MAEDTMRPGEVRFLSRADVTEVLTPRECFERVESTFEWVADDAVEQVDPVNFWLDHDEYGFGAVQAFPSHVKPLEAAGNKWLSAYLGNAERGLPTFTGINVLTDTETAMPLAVLEGQSITAMRTAGHAGVGAKYLARAESSTLTVVGCGHQGRTHLLVMDELFDLDDVRACDVDEGARESFVAEMGPQVGADVTGYADAREAVRGADVVCTVTSADEPIVQAEWLEPGTHVAATAGFLDLDPAYSREADKWAVGWYGRDLTWIEGEESGKFGPEDLSADDVYADLIEVIDGEKPGREHDDERTVMTHMGMPALDTAASHLVYERAMDRDVGTTLTLFER
jgi:ornithine cyclodeaminase/alanine dehydrogenase-like protein (mu-crystallin family)